MTELRGIDRETIREALLDAFTDWGRLENLVRVVLDVHLEHKVSRDSGLEQVADRLIDWAHSVGRLDELIEGAYERARGNPKLAALHETWQARRFVQTVVKPITPKTASAPQQHLTCDRHEAWYVLETATKSAGGHVLFVCGQRGDGHTRFADRIKAFAAQEFQAIVRPLGARVFELPPDTCHAGHVLGDALQTNAANVEQTLASWLEERSVILLYPTVETPEQAAWLRRHDTEHLPALIASLTRQRSPSKHSHGLVAVQPIRWRSGLLDFIPWLSGHARTHRQIGLLDEQGGMSLVGSARLSLWRQHLGPITQVDLAVFFNRVYAADPEARAAVLSRAAGLEGKNAEEIFDWLVEELQ